jgi:hypothetical protein
MYKTFCSAALIFATISAQETTGGAATPASGAAEKKAVTPSQPCLYCRRMDNNAGFLVSYSYCNQTDECLMDAWNYINRPCKDDWKRGSTYELSACNAETITCPEFVSSPEKYGTYENVTWSLAAGGKCDVKVNANKGIARVIFAETSYLGIEPITSDTSVKIGDVVTFESGEQKITIYNGAQSGPITILISFSGAAKLAGSILAATAATTAFLY